MSYYTKSSYNFTYHGLQRCKERLNMRDKEDYEIKERVYQLIDQARDTFQVGNEVYISAGKDMGLYFVVNTFDNLIITCTPMSVEKLYKLFNRS